MDDSALRAAAGGADREPGSDRRGGLTTNQWVILGVMVGLFGVIGAVLVLVLRSASAGRVDILATVIAGPSPTYTPPAQVHDAIATPEGLYWPPEPQPLMTPNAPSDLVWWDSRYLYRQLILLDDIARDSPAGMWARLIFDGEGAQARGEMLADGADLRVVVWDGVSWWEIPRRAQPRLDKRGWEVLFHLQSPKVADQGGYYLYYGNSLADQPPADPSAPETSRLVLLLGQAESVEWGPWVKWTAFSPTTQRIVSADGRVVIECPPGGPQQDVQVRLRTVPVSEKMPRGALPDYELHADPPPGSIGQNQLVRWQPPLLVTLNPAGLDVDFVDLQTWVHFAYDTDTGSWFSVPVEFDSERGLVRFTTDQP